MNKIFSPDIKYFCSPETQTIAPISWKFDERARKKVYEEKAIYEVFINEKNKT